MVNVEKVIQLLQHMQTDRFPTGGNYRTMCSVNQLVIKSRCVLKCYLCSVTKMYTYILQMINYDILTEYLKKYILVQNRLDMKVP